MAFVVFDCETDGIGAFRPPTQTLVQLAFKKVRIADGDVLEQYDAFVTGATKLNTKVIHEGITLEKINSIGVSPKDALRRFLNAIDAETILVAHNAEFDVSLLHEAARKALGESEAQRLLTVRVLCTMRLSESFCAIPKTGYSARRYPDGYKWPTLAELSAKLGVAVSEEKLHDAAYDCDVTTRCLLRGRERGLFPVPLIMS